MGPMRLIRLPGVVIEQEHPEQSVGQYSEQPWVVLSAQTNDRLSFAKQQIFTQQLVEHCLEYFPEFLHELDPEQQLQWAIDCQEQAARHGYSNADDVLRWVRFYGELGPDFPDLPEHANYRQILAEPGVSPAQRLDNLNVELTRQMLTHQGPHL